jgi:hypothetical protein
MSETGGGICPRFLRDQKRGPHFYDDVDLKIVRVKKISTVNT